MATAKMNTVDIKGKPYVLVNERIKAFRENYPGYRLISNIVSLDKDSVIIRAEILNQDGEIMATGLAQEERQSSYINKVSYVENCETSAWGRALGNFGIGIDSSICSADKLANALVNQERIQQEERKARGRAQMNSKQSEPSKQTQSQQSQGVDRPMMNKLFEVLAKYNKGTEKIYGDDTHKTSPLAIAQSYGKEKVEQLTDRELSDAVAKLVDGVNAMSREVKRRESEQAAKTA